jgi:hypothetical protein
MFSLLRATLALAFVFEVAARSRRSAILLYIIYVLFLSPKPLRLTGTQKMTFLEELPRSCCRAVNSHELSYHDGNESPSTACQLGFDVTC